MVNLQTKLLPPKTLKEINNANIFGILLSQEKFQNFLLLITKLIVQDS